MQTLERAGSATSTVERQSAPAPGAGRPDVTTVVLPAARVAWTLLAVVATLTCLSLAGQFTKFYFGHDRVYGLVQLFNVSHEGNIPTWYSSFSLLGCAVLLALVALDERAAGGHRTRYWAGLSLVLLYAAIDEGSGIHELMNRPLQAALDTHGLLYYPAALAGAVFAAALAIVYFRFFWTLPGSTRLLFVASALVYLGGALGVESISARHAERFGQQNMTYAVITTVEELGEMLGVVIFVYALLSYLAEHARPIVIAAGGASGGPGSRQRRAAARPSL